MPAPAPAPVIRSTTFGILCSIRWQSIELGRCCWVSLGMEGGNCFETQVIFDENLIFKLDEPASVLQFRGQASLSEVCKRKGGYWSARDVEAEEGCGNLAHKLCVFVRCAVCIPVVSSSNSARLSSALEHRSLIHTNLDSLAQDPSNEKTAQKHSSKLTSVDKHHEKICKVALNFVLAIIITLKQTLCKHGKVDGISNWTPATSTKQKDYRKQGQTRQEMGRRPRLTTMISRLT